MISYFWDSEIHLTILALAFESCAGIVELAIAAWLFSAGRKEQTEELEQKKENCETWFALVTAILVIVAVGVTWRIVVLQFANEEQQVKQKDRLKQIGIDAQTESNKLNEALNQLVIQSNALTQAQAQEKWRTINSEQESNLVRLLKPYFMTNKMGSNRVWVIGDMRDSEALRYGKRINSVLNECGFDSQIEAIIPDLTTPERTGLTFTINTGNPPPASAIAILNAFHDVGIDIGIISSHLKVEADTNIGDTNFIIGVWHRPEK